MNAFLDYLDAKVPVNSEGNLTAVPALFAGNFQSRELAPILESACLPTSF